MTKLKLAFNEDSLPYLINDADYPCGGWAVELLGWIEGLSDICDPVVMSWEGANDAAGTANTIELIEVWKPKKGFLGMPYFYAFIPRCARALKTAKVDVMIQACAGVSTFFYGLAAKLTGKKFVYRVVNDTDIDDRIHTRLRRREFFFYNLGLRMADMFICQNEYQASSLRKRFPKKAMFTIHNPYKQLGAPQYKKQVVPYIAWLGVFSKQKNLPLLADLVRQTPHVHYKIAGMPAALADAATLEALEQLKAMSNVEYVGYMKRTNVSTFLANARALLNTSHYEGFSNTFLESLAVGKPVITSVGVDPDHIVATNNLGSVVAGPDEYIRAIEHYINAPASELDALKERCTRFVATHHSPDAQAKKFLAGVKSGLGL